MSILSVDTIQPIGSGSTVTLNAAKIVVGTGLGNMFVYMAEIFPSIFRAVGASYVTIYGRVGRGKSYLMDIFYK